MATSFTVHFSPRALARPNSNNNQSRSKTIPKKLSTKSNRKPKLKSRSFPPPSLSSVAGGEAITYTRLPPKDDFFVSPLESPDSYSAEVVKLSELTAIPEIHNSDEELGELSGEDEIVDGDSEFDDSRFELYEVGSDSDYESEDEIDDKEDGNGDLLGFSGSENVPGGGGIEEMDEKEKEKGVPAVMRCFDRAKIFVKSGDGGNGVVAFRREKFVPLGGPSGGDGGRGGNVYVMVDTSMNSLLPFRQSIHFRAGRGSHGQGKKQHGAKGEDVVVKVPPGTVVREAGNNEVPGEKLLELLNPGEKALLLPGGRGGRGNASFKTGMNKVPKIAENGEEGPEM